MTGFSFFSRFSVKVSSLFLVLLLLMGSAQVFITMRITERRQVEIDQLVNWDLARDMVAEIEPVLAAEGGVGDIGEVIHYMMVFNPVIEIYLLDGEGTILAFFAEPGKEVTEDRVDLEPIRRFVSGGEAPPIYGDDPRGAGARKHFSAAPISLADGSTGYLYIVLRSTLYDMAAGRLKEKYLASALVRALVLSILSVGIVGLIDPSERSNRGTTTGASKLLPKMRSGNLPGRTTEWPTRLRHIWRSSSKPTAYAGS